MHALLETGRQRFWDDVDPSERLPDCSEASRQAAANGALTDFTEATRQAVTGRRQNDSLFYRTSDEAKRRMEIARSSQARQTWEELGKNYVRAEIEKEYHAKLEEAERAEGLADCTYETRVAVTGRSFPDALMYRPWWEAQRRMEVLRETIMGHPKSESLPGAPVADVPAPGEQKQLEAPAAAAAPAEDQEESATAPNAGAPASQEAAPATADD